MIYKGTIGDTGATITTMTLPNSTAKIGWTYKAIKNGDYTVGTGSGTTTTTVKCEVGDMIICLKKGSSSTYATWTVVQNNIDGAVTGPASSTSNNLASFNGTTGKVIKDSGLTTAGVSDAVDKKHSHSSLTLSTTAQAYDGTHTLALPSSDPYNTERTPASHTHGNITNTGELQDTDITIASGDKLVVTDSSDSGKIARTKVKFDGTDITKALTPKGTFETFVSTAASQGLSDTEKSNARANIGLGNVANTGDSATPVENGTTKFTTGGAYTELNKKVDKVTGKGLSTNDYTNEEKDKLANIAAGAEVNVQADWNEDDSSSDAFINNKPVIPQLPDPYNGHEYVDLGLSSGTLWATMNVGASSETDYGNYYMYGMGSKTYDSADTPYAGTEDPLDLSKDTARVVWGGSWHMPTREQMQELKDNTTYQWVTNYKGSGINGGTFTATNGAVLFIPAAGYWYNGSQSNVGNFGYYWGSSPNGSNNAYYLGFINGYKSVSSDIRKNGYPVRPVITLSNTLHKVSVTGDYNDLNNKPTIPSPTAVKGDAESEFRTGNVNITPANIGLGNVGNFKAVSTVANQGLTDTEKSNARTNIGAGTSSFSGSYNDLTDKPTIPTIPISLPANGGDADTVNGHTVNSDVPANAVFTDTTYKLTIGSTTNIITYGDFTNGTSLGTLGTAALKDVPTSGNASNTQVVLGSDSRLANNIRFTIEKTWSELKALRDNSTLVPGQWYRITDYVTTTTTTDTQSAGYAFDIIVRADRSNALNENAYAAKHSGDSHFSSDNMSAWELKYCINNDTDRFAWADSTNGKGVIYYMKDEFNNECPYDFKNIRFKVGAKTQPGTKDNVYYYTFSASTVTNDTTVTDHSRNGRYCHDNCIKRHISSGRQTLNFNIFRNTAVSSGCYNNIFGDSCHNNIFGSSCYSNTFGNGFYSNIFGSSCYSNIFGSSCYSNIFGNLCSYNTFENYCVQNIFGNSCNDNTFGSNCIVNTFGMSCTGNTFGNNCSNNTFGNYCSNNTFGNYCKQNTFAKNYCEYNIIENGNQYITLTSTQTMSSSYKLRNIKICQGVNNTSTTKTISHNTLNDTFQTEYKPANSQTILV